MGLDPVTGGLILGGGALLGDLFSGDPGSAASDAQGNILRQLQGISGQLLTPEAFSQATGSLGTGPGALPGYASYLPQLVSQFASVMGVPNPYANSGTQGNEYFGGTAPAIDPYKLDTNQQRSLNQTQDTTNQGRKAALERVRARLAEQGIRDPSTLAAAEMRLNEAYDTQLAEQQTAAGTKAKESKAAALPMLMQMIGSLYETQAGAKKDALSQILSAAGLLGGTGQSYGQVAQRQQGSDNSLWGSLGSLGAMLLTGGFGNNNAGGVWSGLTGNRDLDALLPQARA